MSLNLTDGKLLWCLSVCSFLQEDARNAVQISLCSPHTGLEQLLIMTVSQDKRTMRVYRNAAGFRSLLCAVRPGPDSRQTIANQTFIIVHNIVI